MDKKTFERFDETFPLKGIEVEKYGEASEIPGELNQLNNISKELSSLNSVEVDQNYFATILPRFYENQNKLKYSFSFRKLAYSASLAFTTIIMMFISFQNIPKPEILVQNNGTQTQISSYAEDSYIASADQFSDSVVDDTNFQTEIDNTITQSISSNGSGSNYNLIKNDTDYDKVLTQLNDEELENIYSQLQDVKIL
ncbi:MAG: hypothetical protein WC209_08895 [Ignavibacteriaceae bacterium]